MSIDRARPVVGWTRVHEPHGVEKIVALPDLLKRVEAARAAGETVVFTNGCFDLLHPGHVHCLQGARALGDMLIVGVNSDASTARLKGPTRPILPQADRCALLAALSVVDQVIVFEEDSPVALLQALKPHVHAKGTDYTQANVPEREAVLAYGGRIAITGDAKRPGSRGIVATILERHASGAD